MTSVSRMSSAFDTKLPNTTPAFGAFTNILGLPYSNILHYLRAFYYISAFHRPQPRALTLPVPSFSPPDSQRPPSLESDFEAISVICTRLTPEPRHKQHHGRLSSLRALGPAAQADAKRQGYTGHKLWARGKQHLRVGGHAYDLR